MTAIEFYLICFIVGLVLSVLSFALGASHLHLHLPRPWGHTPHVPHVGHAAHPSGGAHGAHGAHAELHHSVAPLNFATIMVFLTWFGAAGALLVGPWHASGIVAFAVSSCSGFLGSALVFL